MKKQIILLLSSLIALAAICSILWYVSARSNSQDSFGSNSKINSEELVSITNSAAAKIAITLSDESYTITKNGDAYDIDGYESKFLSQPLISSCAIALSKIDGELISKNPTDLQQYGLSNPCATAAITTDSGTVTLFLGDTSMVGGRYFSLKGSSAVYHFASTAFETMVQGALTFVSKTVTSPPQASAQAQNIRVLPQEVSFSGEKYATPLVLQKKTVTEFEKQYSLYSYAITSHGGKDASKEIVLSSLASLFEITADSVIAYNPTEEQLLEYGFDTPYAATSFSWLDKDSVKTEVTIKVQTDKSGQIFVMREGTPIIYAVSRESLPWLDMQYETIVSRLALVPDLGTVASVAIVGEGVKEKYLIDIKNDTISVSCNGKLIDSARFQTFYEQLISLSGEQFTAKAPDDSLKKLLTITYTYLDGSFDTVEMLENTPLMAYLSVNGKSEFLTAAKYSTTIIENAKILSSSGDLKPLY